MHDCHLIPEIQSEFLQHLRGQRDFRHQQDGVFPLVQRVLDEANIHLGFAAAGNAVQQRCLGLAALLQLLQPQKGGLLLLIQCNRLRCFGFQQFGHPTDLNGFCGQNSQRYQTPDERSTHTGQVAHLFFWQLTGLMDHPQHFFPPFFQRTLTDLAQSLFQRQGQPQHGDLFLPDILLKLLLHGHMAAFYQLCQLFFDVLGLQKLF